MRLDRETLVQRLVDHKRSPRHWGRLPDAEVSVPGGNPECGDLITVHVTGDDEGRIREASFEGEGCTISQGAASILLQKVNRERPTFATVSDFPYDEMIDLLGREVVGFRHRCATLALGTLKAAVRAIETNRKLRAAGYSEAEVRKLRETVARPGAGSGG